MMRNLKKNNHRNSRGGAVLVLLLVSLVTLLTFVALAVDLGMLAVARTQLQDAADAGAMAGARTLNGSTGNNYSNSAPDALTAATANTVLSKAIASTQVTTQIGRYTYVSANQRFEGQFPGPSTENWSMVQTQVSANIGSQLAFSKVFNFTGSNISATATAVHRPRDIAIILDYSGSMRFASLMGDPHTGDRTTNNPDSVFPVFGHYSNQAAAALQATSFTSPYDPANITTTTSDGRAPIVRDFYSDGNGTLAFSSASAGYATVPGGDNFLKINKNAGASYCSTVAGLLNIGSVSNSTRDATFETSGYQAYAMAGSFAKYTQGPGYWGKTFFIWPPDPRAANDWRQLYFSTTDNSHLWDSSGNWISPTSGGYTINYTAILNFIKNVGPNAFPSQLQSGRIVYYTAIPNSINTGTFPPANLNERFWKDYIDYCLGVVQTGSNSWIVITDGSTGYAGYGYDYAFGTVKITAQSSLTGNPKPYMHYKDNPLRPGTHFWFGPMSMVDFLGNYNMWYQINPSASRFCWWPGTCHESPMYACKLGIRAALTDISNNHPNDLVSLSMFSVPCASVNDGGRFNRVRVGLSRDYSDMQDSLWYPPATVGNSAATVTPYDSNNLEVPRAYGGTCYAMGLMQAFNQFSGNTSLVSYNPGEPAGDAGGNGRQGAQKIIIFETDGAPNTTASATLNNLGAYNSYYAIRYNSSNPGASEFPTGINGYSDNASTCTTQIFNLCTQICALDTASPPGYSSPSKKALIHCIAFGPVIAPGSPASAGALATLNQMQTIGNVTDGMPSYKVIYGSEASVASGLQQAFTQILQSGVQVSLIQ